MARIAIRLGMLELRRLVTLLALGLDMLAQQRELGLVVVKANVVALPTALVVAVLALLALLAVMLIVLLVAGIALRRRFVAESRRGMAFVALRILVLEFQGILGVLVVIEARVFPVFLVMALVALIAQVAVVPLVVIRFLVAVVANLRQLLLVKFTGMALVALDLKVLEAQRILGVLIVIKKRFLPVVFLMAALTLLTKVALVRLFVVLSVARPAIQR